MVSWTDTSFHGPSTVGLFSTSISLSRRRPKADVLQLRVSFCHGLLVSPVRYVCRVTVITSLQADIEFARVEMNERITLVLNPKWFSSGFRLFVSFFYIYNLLRTHLKSIPRFVDCFIPFVQPKTNTTWSNSCLVDFIACFFSFSIALAAAIR